MALSTVSGILTKLGMGRLGRLGLERAVRYERERPGELIHIDVKKLGRIKGGAGHRMTGHKHYNRRRIDREGSERNTVGWEYVHIAIDDCTRLAYAEVLGDEKATTVVAFLRRAVAFFARHGMTVEQLLTDNGSGYRSLVHAIACRTLGSATCAPAPTGPRPMARQRGSSAPCSAAGPTVRSTATAPSAPPHLTAGCGPTTITENTQPSATSPRSLASTSEPTYSVLTPRRGLSSERTDYFRGASWPPSPGTPRLRRAARAAPLSDTGPGGLALRRCRLPAASSGKRAPFRAVNRGSLIQTEPFAA